MSQEKLSLTKQKSSYDKGSLIVLPIEVSSQWPTPVGRVAVVPGNLLLSSQAPGNRNPAYSPGDHHTGQLYAEPQICSFSPGNSGSKFVGMNCSCVRVLSESHSEGCHTLESCKKEGSTHKGRKRRRGEEMSNHAPCKKVYEQDASQPKACWYITSSRAHSQKKKLLLSSVFIESR